MSRRDDTRDRMLAATAEGLEYLLKTVADVLGTNPSMMNELYRLSGTVKGAREIFEQEIKR